MNTDRYQIVKQLGSGSLGPIFEARDRHLDRPVAVRQLAPSMIEDLRLLNLVIDRMEKMSAVSHPHVMTIHSVESRRQPPILVVELLSGKTVTNLLGESPISPERVARWLGQGLEGLQQLHHHGVVHGDLRPSQIFVQRDSLKLGDFGRSALDPQSERTLESLRYAAPETIEGVQPLSPTTDIFVLGLIAYELTLGTERFLRVVVELLEDIKVRKTNAESKLLWRKFHLSPAVLPRLREIDPSIPKTFSDAIAHMLAKDPADRPQSCSAVLRELATMRGWTAIFEAVQKPVRDRDIADEPLDGLLRQISPRRAIVLLAMITFLGLITLFLRNQGQKMADAQHGVQVVDTVSTLASEAVLESPGEVVEQLMNLVDENATSSLHLTGERKELVVGEPLSFVVSSPQDAYAALFVISADGTIQCLYPNRRKPYLQIRAGMKRTLPSVEDNLLGIALTVDLPTGEDHAFLLTSKDALPSPPLVQILGNDWLLSFPFKAGPENPAVGFLRWVERSTREPDVELTHLCYLVTARTTRP